ncbi:MAG: hypothetical protein E6J00_09800 [Chloroflexi bacterium]|nr:MAG: hypothetical protein E6J00_09800 [Chloroflexota bacterium]
MSALLDVAEALDQIPEWRGRVQVVAPLEGGITNRNYRVLVDGASFVVRIPAANGHLLGIDRAVEHLATRLAAAAGVGPEVVAFVSPPGLLVTRFIEGTPVGLEAIKAPETMRRIVESLRRVHGAGSLPASFSPFRVVEAYAETSLAHGVKLPEVYAELRLHAAEIERALAGEPACLCHNDLLNANFIDDGAAIRIVDWEYAGMGDRFFDFGNFAVNHELGEEEERMLLAEYFGSGTPRDLARLRLMRIMSDFREAMWGLVQQGVSTLEVDFADYAQRHFERLLRATADVRYPRWLSACA